MPGDNVAMPRSPIAQKLRALRERAGLEIRAIVRQIGRSGQPNAYAYYENKYKRNALPREFVEKLKPLFVGRGDPPITEMEMDDLAGIPTTPVAIEMNKDDDLKKSRVVLYLSLPIPGDRVGAHVLTKTEVGDVPRPDTIDPLIKNAFSFRLLDDRNAPRFRNRETIVVDPTYTGIEGEDCVFMADFDGVPRVVVVIGTLVRSTDDLWIITQYGAPGVELEIPKSQYPNAWPIKGHSI